jgi:FAD/FMN-containing dehydrogenase
MLDATASRYLDATFRGEIIRPGHHRYDEARRVWNGQVDRRPQVIARCTGTADVRAALTFARERELLTAVRGGGHNVAGNAVCDDGLVIDLSPLKGVRVDPVARTARAQPGVTWGLFDRETQVFGLATTGGLVSTTGIAGLTLGGGIGWLARKHGTACDNLLSADVVTADGSVVTASATENPELFWGLQGGGGNFGVVTSLEYRLHPVGPHVLAGPVFHAGAHAADVLRFFRDYVATAPDELTVVASFMTAPVAPFLPPDAHETLVVALAVCYAGDLAEGERVLRPLRGFGRPLADLIAPTPYTALQRMSDEGYPSGLRNYWKSSYVDELSDAAIDTVVEHATRMPSPRSAFYFEHLGGAIARPAEPTAFGHRDATFDLAILAIWEDREETDLHVAWTRGFWEAMQPHARHGVYVNNLGEEGHERVRSAYEAHTYERLVRLKELYDPANVFRCNQNIAPRAAVPAGSDWASGRA